MTAINLPGQLGIPLALGLPNDPKAMDIGLFDSVLEVSAQSPSGLVWRKTMGRAIKGNPAGGIRESGYYLVTVNKKTYMAHRIIFALIHKIDPMNYHIDHIDGDTKNNSPDNLRITGRIGNNSNAAKRSDNTSGIKGMFIRKRNGRKDLWICTVVHDGVLHKKSFSMSKKAEAIEWLRNTRIKLHGEFHNHG